MRVNVEKVLERDSKLSELDHRAGEQQIYVVMIHYELITRTNYRCRMRQWTYKYLTMTHPLIKLPFQMLFRWELRSSNRRLAN